MHADAIDRILRDTMTFIQTSQREVFDISQQARSEFNSLQKEWEKVRVQLQAISEKLEGLEKEYRKARKKLSEVSSDFQRYKEDDIRKAYEQALAIQTEIIRCREQKRHCKKTLEDLRKRLSKQEQIMERAETVVAQMSVVYKYLTGDLTQVARIVESAKHRQLMAFKIILAQEEERKRIAREIHDGPAQSMAQMVLRSELTLRLVEKGQYDDVRQEMEELKKQLRAGLEEIRKIIFNLRPMTLDDLGLLPTLRKLVKEVEDQEKIHSVLEIKGRETRLPPAVEVAVYRLVQEAIANAVKHACATFLSVRLHFKPQELCVEIADNGKGFDLDRFYRKAEAAGRFGLLGMRERVQLLEGRLDIRTGEGEGTRITASIPLRPGKEEVP